ncbi:hypothetical protein WA026_017963 [Henosepilachna vigintioctopunctata]|uniref:Farnesyl pyrophosphate synthase n=1 Tax=Henosepilachna vigintioctopunctata TaxID=420089 RepID=A0AAW1TVY8_9CUCU
MNPNFATEKRFIPNVQKKRIRNPNDLKFLPVDEVLPFMDYFPRIVEDATQKESILNYPKVSQRLRKFLNYYCTAGRHMRQHILIYVYKMIEEHFGTFDQKNMEDVYKLGWCLELHNCQFMLVDDLIDNHEMRKGKKAWHKLENIGVTSLLDSYLVQSSMFYLLKKYFSSHPHYVEILESFSKLDLVSGMLLELEAVNLKDFTLQALQDAGTVKTSYYGMAQPFYLAVLLANKSLYLNEMMNKVFDHIGFLCTIQNDMVDCFADELGGKPGTDIQENKCVLPIVLALRKASPQQKKILEECYGVNDNAKIKRVKEIYEELDVIGEYFELETEIHNKIAQEIAKIPDKFVRSLMDNLIYIYTFGEIGTPLE